MKKLTKATVQYRQAPYGARERCATCTMFQGPGRCTLVQGHIDPNAVCDRFYDKAGALTP